MTFRRRQWHPTPVLLPGKSHGWSSLVGCSPWGHQEPDTTEQLTFTFHFHALEKEMATHSSVLAWRIPGTGEPGGLPSMGSHRVRHDWSDSAAVAAKMTFNSFILQIMWLWWRESWVTCPVSPWYIKSKVSCSVVSDSLRPMACSPPGSSGLGILQIRILEWVAISSSRGSSQPWWETRFPTLQADSFFFFFTVWPTREAHIKFKAGQKKQILDSVHFRSHHLYITSIFMYKHPNMV